MTEADRPTDPVWVSVRCLNWIEEKTAPGGPAGRRARRGSFFSLPENQRWSRSNDYWSSTVQYASSMNVRQESYLSLPSRTVIAGFRVGRIGFLTSRIPA